MSYRKIRPLAKPKPFYDNLTTRVKVNLTLSKEKIKNRVRRQINSLFLCLKLSVYENCNKVLFVISGFQVSLAECGGCHSMVLGVPNPDYDPNKENFGQHKPSINGSINDELNVLARERRRSRFTFFHFIRSSSLDFWWTGLNRFSFLLQHFI